ncbi:probable beta-1,4-xylosyltransferase IRX9 [Hordeum vulgare subsp. vulgare]|uniref:Glycosyltransferases n=1 Tax=Hordeum vulgare subsp. vulgare TaxID=112509 RepID=A0A8I6X1H8_HORVV|nr:probable beta-1,4-xylosyltransferase IRX9 [Hordeum vulgare subsp. vulgare]
MASPKKTKPRARRPLLLRRAMLHSSLCFLLGLLAGLAPAFRWTHVASTAATAHVFRALHAVDGAFNHTVLLLQQQQRQLQHGHVDVAAAALPSPPPPETEPLRQPQLLLVVTATERSDPERRAAGLTRAAHALRLVPPPVLWLVVERATEAPATARLLRGAGVSYRHLAYPENFTADGVGVEKERHHQRNVALGHVEEHRLDGVVLFAGLGDVHDLRFFDQLRQIRKLGAWPVATVSERERKATVEGPLCGGSPWAVTGWFSTAGATPTARAARPPVGTVDVARFAFGNALLWDPHRWDSFPVSEPDASQDSIKFVQRLAAHEYNESRGMPDPDCSEIMVWRGDQLVAT